MITMWIEVDFDTFADARAIAKDHGDLLRSTDHDAGAFLRDQSISTIDLIMPIGTTLPDYGALITTGLFKGVFRYKLNPNQVWWWCPSWSTPAPRRGWRPDELVDVAISYATEDLSHHAAPLASALAASGLSTYMIDVTQDPDDPMWRIRYREGLMHSRFFIPILTPRYLARTGTQSELLDIERLTIRHRSSEHFYPLLPWRPDSASPEDIRDSWKGDTGNPENWLLGHVFPLSAAWDHEKLASFISSLTMAAKAIEAGHRSTEIHYLVLLRDHVSSAGTPDCTPEWTAKFTVEHPWWRNRHYEFFIRHDGRVRWVGLGELERPVSRPRVPYDDILMRLSGWPWEPHVRSSQFQAPSEMKPPSGRRFWLGADSAFRSDEPLGAVYYLSSAFRAGFDSPQWLAKLGRAWSEAGFDDRARGALTVALNGLGAADYQLERVLSAQLSDIGGGHEVLKEVYVKDKQPGVSEVDEFGYSATARMFGTLSPKGLFASSDCLSVREYFVLAGDYAKIGDEETAVAIMECCVNTAASPEVKGRALYMAAKTLLLVDSQSLRGQHYIQKAHGLFPNEPGIRELYAKYS